MDSASAIPQPNRPAVDPPDLHRLLVLASRTAVLESTARGLVHEVRNPLQAIALATQTLPPTPSESELAFVTGAVDRAAAHLTRTATTMSQIFRAGESQVAPIVLPDVVAFVREVERFQRTLPPVTVEVVIPPRLPAVSGIEVSLSHALLNLVINSKEAMAGRRPASGRVTIRLEDLGDIVRLSVEDDGPGVRDGAESLFRPFVTTKVGHLGLGLPVARLLVEPGGGTVQCVVGGGDGARFVLDLPVWRRGSGPSSGDGAPIPTAPS